MNLALKDEALRLNSTASARRFNVGHDGPHYFGPGCDIAGADDVGVLRKTAPGADELGLAPAIRLVDTSTDWTRSARVARIDEHDRDAREGGLVFEECTQLEERPPVQMRSLSLFHRCPGADALEILQCDSSIGALGLANDLLADDVVGVSVEMLFSPAKPSEVALGALGAAALKSSAELSNARPDSQRRLSRVHLGVGVHRQVADSQIDPKPPLGIDRSSVRHLDGDEQVELAAAVDQIGLTAHAVESSCMVGAYGARDDNAPVEREQAQAVKPVLEAIQALVIRDGAEHLEAAELRAIALVDLADFRDGAHCVLSGQAEALSDLPVVELLEPDLVGRLNLECSLGQPRARLVDPSDRREQASPFFRGRQQFHRGNELHGHRRSTSKPARNRPGRFLPAVNDGASAAAKAQGGST